MVESFAKPIKRASEYLIEQSELAQSAPAKDDLSIWQRVKNALLEDGETTATKARANARRHAQQLAPLAQRVSGEMDNLLSIVKRNRQDIDPHLGTVGKTSAKVMGMAPELLLSGPSRARLMTNRAISAIKDFGEHQNIPGAITEFLIPGNSVVGNIVQNIATEQLAAMRRKAALAFK